MPTFCSFWHLPGSGQEPQAPDVRLLPTCPSERALGRDCTQEPAGKVHHIAGVRVMMPLQTAALQISYRLNLFQLPGAANGPHPIAREGMFTDPDLHQVIQATLVFQANRLERKQLFGYKAGPPGFS